MSRYSSHLAAWGVGAAFIWLCIAAFGTSPSADFRAIWQAGEMFAAGRFGEIYPADSAYFTMRPPEAWITALRQEGYTGQVYPFIYPPLWAWAASLVVGVMKYETLLSVVRVVNAAMLLGMLAAARRMAAPAVPLSVYWLVGVLLLVTTTTGTVALFENQPQILVAFLTVLAVERAERGHGRTGGVILAVAAAIKLYPALYALLWLASGQKRAAAAFGLSGAALGIFSLAVGGWPLHAEFLRLLGFISDTALITKLCYAWESIVAQLFWADQLVFVEMSLADPDVMGSVGWQLLHKPPVLSLTFKVLQLAALIWMIRAFFQTRQSGEVRPWLWPAAFAIFSLLGPIAWAYHYLSLLAFVPAFLTRWRSPAVGVLVLLWAACASVFLPAVFADAEMMTPRVSFVLELAGTLWITVMALIFLWQARRPQPSIAAAPACLAQ